MTKLVGVNSVATRYTIPNEPVLLSKMAASLDATSIYLESILKTAFLLDAAVQDLYTFGKGGTAYDDDENWYFRLSRGFLNAAPEIRIGPVKADLADESEVSDEYWACDTVKGILSLSKQYLAEYGQALYQRSYSIKRTLFLSVDYSAGFTAAEDIYGQVYSGVPGWLMEAATIYGFSVYSGEDCDKKTKKNERLAQAISSMLNEHIRYIPYAQPLS